MSIVMESLKKEFGEPPSEVLKGISGKIDSSEFVSITGRSGSGKSTLLYIISSLDKPTSGRVIIDGKDLSTLNSEEIHRFRNQRMGFVFQFHHLLPELTALENTLMPAMKSKTELARRDYAMKLFEDFGIKDKAHRLPSKLSGGEQQRVAIARALIMEPAYLFADEPTGNLDSVNGAAVMNLFRSINEVKKTTVIFVTHDIEFAKLARRTINLADGRLS